MSSRPTRPSSASDQRGDEHPAGGERDRRERVGVVAGHQEVRRAAEHRQRRPRHPDRAEVGAGQHVEDQQQAQGRDDGAGDGDPAGPLAVPQPEEDDDRGRGGELDQQRGCDLHVRHGGEVGELRQRHGHHAVDREGPHVPAQQVPAAAHRDQRRTAAPRPRRWRCAAATPRRASSRCRAGRAPARPRARTTPPTAPRTPARTRARGVRTAGNVSFANAVMTCDATRGWCNLSTWSSHMTPRSRSRPRSPW